MPTALAIQDDTEASQYTTDPELSALEAVIEDGLYSALRAWATIRERRLYRRAGYGTWEEYTLVRFGYSRRHVDEMIDALPIQRLIGAMAPENVTITERQARALAPLYRDRNGQLEGGEEAVRSVWREAVSNGETSTPALERRANEYMAQHQYAIAAERERRYAELHAEDQVIAQTATRDRLEGMDAYARDYISMIRSFARTTNEVADDPTAAAKFAVPEGRAFVLAELARAKTAIAKVEEIFS